MLIKLITFAAAFLLSYFGVEYFRRWSIKKGIVDLPNERSSHAVPTPRGGGIVIVAVCLVFYVLISVIYTHHFAWGYFAGAILIALISWLDDLHSISFAWRFLVHSAAAALVIFDLGFLHSLYIPAIGYSMTLGISGMILTLLWIVWLINAYNFMDGIDGIAGLQAVLAAIGWYALGMFLGESGIYFYSGVLAVASLGFLIHNWPPAKIFMGDVGSSFLGFTFAVMPLLALDRVSDNAVFLPIASILLIWFFVFDAALTLFVRLFGRKKIWNAHREHIYQRRIIAGASHRSVTLLYGAFTSIVIFSAAVAIIYRGISEIFLVFITLFLSAALIFLGYKKRMT